MCISGYTVVYTASFNFVTLQTLTGTCTWYISSMACLVSWAIIGEDVVKVLPLNVFTCISIHVYMEMSGLS